jgi:Putative beta barrel porin-7 (BBP7)
MKVLNITFLMVVVGGAVCASAQTVAPPPGFSPSFSDDRSSPTDPPPPSIDTDHDDGNLPEPVVPNSRFYGLRGGRGAFPNPLPPPSRSIVAVDPQGLIPDVVPFPNVWFSAETLIWWNKSSPVPVPLVTDGTTLSAGSPVVLGNQSLPLPTSGGGRFTLGFGFGADRVWAAEGSYFFLNNGGVSQGVTSDGSPGSAELSFPFYNPNLPGEDSSPIASPGQWAGTAVVSVTSRLQGFDANILRTLGGNGPVRFDVLGGFRYVNLQENLTFTTDSPNVYPNPSAFFNTFDAFNTQSNFYGAQIGGRATYDNGLLFCNATGKLALGDSLQTVGINGATITNFNGPYQTAAGGYLSQPSNIGSQTASRFAVIPELNMNFGVYLTPWAKLTFGYSFLFISSVARPGDQIDRVINPTQSSAISNNFPATLSGVARPGIPVQSSTFWAQGLNLGVEFRY